MFEERTVFIVSSIKIVNGNSAGAARMMNIARALTLLHVRVFLCSSTERWKGQPELQQLEPHIFNAVNKADANGPWYYRFARFFIFLNYLFGVRKFANTMQGPRCFYLYPTTEMSMDFAVLVLLKFFYRERVFYEVNELRRAGLVNVTFSINKPKMIYQRLVWLLQLVGFWVVEFCTVFYDGLVVISTTLEKYFYRYNKSILRIPILSNIPADVPPAPTFQMGQTFRLCFAGMITLKKEGFDTFYEALSLLKNSYPNFELHLYGSITNDEKVQLLNQLPRAMNIENNIVYHGVVAQRELMKELQKHHLLILPRPWNLQTHYGFSTKLSEYLVSGIPTLVTAVSDNALYVEDGKNGFVVSPGKSDELAGKILYAIQHYSIVASEMAHRAFQDASKSFSVGIHAPRIHGFFFDISTNPGPAKGL